MEIVSLWKPEVSEGLVLKGARPTPLSCGEWGRVFQNEGGWEWGLWSEMMLPMKAGGDSRASQWGRRMWHQSKKSFQVTGSWPQPL